MSSGQRSSLAAVRVPGSSRPKLLSQVEAWCASGWDVRLCNKKDGRVGGCPTLLFPAFEGNRCCRKRVVNAMQPQPAPLTPAEGLRHAQNTKLDTQDEADTIDVEDRERAKTRWGLVDEDPGFITRIWQAAANTTPKHYYAIPPKGSGVSPLVC